MYKNMSQNIYTMEILILVSPAQFVTIGKI